MITFFKITGYGLLFSGILLLAVVAFISRDFSSTHHRDGFPVKGDYLQYYPGSYDAARDTFRLLTRSLARQYPGVRLQEIKVPSSEDDDLTIGSCYLPARSQKRQLLILSSGVHGVEGYVGHAVQELFIRRLLNDEMLQHTGVLLLHSVNPYGFRYNQRVTENNVDLNRNASLSGELYSTVNESYPMVYDLINPKKKVKVASLENRLFFLKAAQAMMSSSTRTLRQAVLQGQYQYPEGLYFGGFHPEPQITALGELIRDRALPYERILMIDLHTGYGERGKLHLFINPLPDHSKQKVEELFEGYPIDWGDSEDFYTITGDFLDYVNSMMPEKDFYPMCFEYGTLNSQTTMGSIKSLHRMILENQGRRHGYVSQEDAAKAQKGFLEMYFPSSPLWRNYIMEQTEEILEKTISKLAN